MREICEKATVIFVSKFEPPKHISGANAFYLIWAKNSNWNFTMIIFYTNGNTSLTTFSLPSKHDNDNVLFVSVNAVW